MEKKKQKQNNPLSPVRSRVKEEKGQDCYKFWSTSLQNNVRKNKGGGKKEEKTQRQGGRWMG